MTPLQCCEIGAHYAATGDRDLVSLESAARRHVRSQFAPEALERELRDQPEIVAGWLAWAADKRWSPAWYFCATGDGQYMVGYFSTDDTQRTQTLFNDQFSACASFIIHELEDYNTRHGSFLKRGGAEGR